MYLSQRTRRQINKVAGKNGKGSEVGDEGVKKIEKEKENKMAACEKRRGRGGGVGKLLTGVPSSFKLNLKVG